MTKKALREENAWLWNELHEFEDAFEKLCRENRQLRRENKGLRRANIALGEEVNFRQDKIDRVIRYCECKIREKKGVPAWLKEVIRDA
jgi:hypothetical protein